MLQNGWEHGFCGRCCRKQRGPVIYPSQWSWLNTSQRHGRWKSHTSTLDSLLPNTVRSTAWNGHSALEKLSRRCLRGLLAKANSLQEQTRGFSPHSESRAPPYSKRTGCLFLEEQLGMLHMPSYNLQGGACSRELMGPMVSQFLETLGSAGVRSATRDESVRLLPTLGFFITRMPCCSWFWEGLCPHTK